MSLAASELAAHPNDSRVEPRSNFAIGFALTMLTLNVVGFAPTLYLRPFFDVPPIPGYLYLHGAIGTAWFVLVLLQALLIANRRVALHRRLGWIGAALAVTVLVSGMFTSENMVPRNVAAGRSSEADIALYTTVTAADNASFVVFPALVLLAIYFRRRADIHKRLMLIASLSILGPAAARIASWQGPFPSVLAAVVMWGLVVSLIAYDLRTRRWRPHLATVLGLLLFFAVNIGAQVSGLGAALVEQRMP